MRLTILEIDQVVYDGDFEYVVVPGIDGVLTIYPKHTPLLTMLKPGILKYKTNNNIIEKTISRGMVKVNSEEVIIIL